MKENLYRLIPFITIPRNRCIACGSELVLVNTDINIQQLNENGCAGKIIVSHYDSTIRCPACNMKYQVCENWDGSLSPILDGEKIKAYNAKVKNDFCINAI